MATDDGSRRIDGGMQPKPAIFALSRACIERGTGSSNPTLGSFVLSKNTWDSAIVGDQINAFCPRFCPRKKAIKEPGWCGLDAPGQQFIHRPRTWLSQPTSGQRLRKPCRNPGHLCYPRLHPACSQAACQGRARAPQSTMTKVGKSHSKGTFVGGVRQRRGCADSRHSPVVGDR